jgi:hypothetical protein
MFSSLPIRPAFAPPPVFAESSDCRTALESKLVKTPFYDKDRSVSGSLPPISRDRICGFDEDDESSQEDTVEKVHILCNLYRTFKDSLAPFATFCTVMSTPAHSFTCDTRPAF